MCPYVIKHLVFVLQREPICSQMMKELRFAMKCFGSSKKMAKTYGSKAASEAMIGDTNGMTPMMPIGFERMDASYPMDQGYTVRNHTVPTRGKEVYT